MAERRIGRVGGVMTVLAERPVSFAEAPEPHHEHGPSGFLKWVTSTDHKVIGKNYTVTAVIFFLLAGAMAMLIRAQLANPDSTLLSQHTYNEMFTMHGSLMIYLFVGPVAFGGLANYIVPLQIGAPDMAFPRLNALSYWLYLGGGLLMMTGFLTTGSAADFGWVAYAPLSNSINTPGAGPDLWIVALILTGFSAIFTGVNLVSTIYYLRAPGMTMFRMPIFTWNMLVTGILILIAFPVFTSALVFLWCDRHLGAHIFEVQGGGVPVLWQDLFWFFGHPEVYILALPFFGIVTDVIAVFSRKPIFGYRGMVFATISIAALSTSVWAHHMFTTGVVLLPFFSLMSYLIAVPTGIKFFNWIGTMWRGSVKFDTPMLFCIGFLGTFLVGGVSGILLASPPIDFATHDTYFVVAHFHSVVMALVMGAFAGFFYWYPKMTGRMLREGLGKATFWLMFIGTNVTFDPQYLLGLKGMPRRIAEYAASDGYTTLNRISSVGAAIIFISVAIFVVNVVVSWWNPIPAGDNPWDAATLEWATTSPPPHHNFLKIPPIRSRRPVWDYNHPEDRILDHAHKPRLGELVAAGGGTAVLLDEIGFDGEDGAGSREPDR
ncbi:MAG: cytochrome c oxidase subunit I [Acidimicrobiales bacterium]|jgi:cytochrome c oxidase subunit 1